MHVKKVTRRFLQNLARKIYNPKTGTYLRLCRGTLQNGPDPKDKTRTMHCGLGELFYAMTGKQPRGEGVGYVSESVVCQQACEAAGDAGDRGIYSYAPTKLYTVLRSIDGENDSTDRYDRRAKKVAAKLLEAAKLLPAK